MPPTRRRATRVDFDDLSPGTVVGEQYAGLGLHIADTQQFGVIPTIVAASETTSPPNSLFNNTQRGDNTIVPLTFSFDQGQAKVGLYLGNGETAQPEAILSAFDRQGNLIGRVSRQAPEPVSAFLGIASETGIYSATLSYRDSTLGEQIHISGSITDTTAIPGADRGRLMPALRLTGDMSATPSAPGDFSISLEDVGNTTLISRTFPMTFTEEGTPPEHGGTDVEIGFFSFILPWQATADHIVLYEKGTELDRLTLSTNTPLVAVTAPAAAATWSGTHTITWQAGDADGDPLSYAVFYSGDGGLSWLPLANGLSQTSLEVGSQMLPGSTQAQVRVLASDGINTGLDTSPVFSVTTKAPQVSINQPGDNQTFASNAPVLLLGSAQDAEDGVLSGLALSWSSDLDGALGTGDTLLHAPLSTGLHQITLAASTATARPARRRFRCWWEITPSTCR